MKHRSNRQSTQRHGVVNVTVPERCPVDQFLHVSDTMRCVEIVANEPVQLVVTLVCGCPLVAVRFASFDGLVA